MNFFSLAPSHSHFSLFQSRNFLGLVSGFHLCSCWDLATRVIILTSALRPKGCKNHQPECARNAAMTFGSCHCDYTLHSQMGLSELVRFANETIGVILLFFWCKRLLAKHWHSSLALRSLLNYSTRFFSGLWSTIPRTQHKFCLFYSRTSGMIS